MPSIKEQTQQLYRLCFNDDDAFTEAYFKYIYRSECNRVSVRNGRVISALQIVPVSILLRDYAEEGIPCGYISGACTHNSYRGKGIMRKLLTRTLSKMRKQGAGFATLIPASEGLFHFYGISDFVKCFDYSVETLHPLVQTHPWPSSKPLVGSLRWSAQPIEDPIEELTCKILTPPENLYYSSYIHCRKNFQGYHSYFGNFEKLVERDMEIEGGQAWCVYTPEDLLVGYAICYPKDSWVEIPSLTTDSPGIRNHLIKCIGNYYALSTLKVHTEPELSLGIRHLGMARAVHVPELLEKYAAAHPEVCAEFSLLDSLLPDNNGTYTLPGNGQMIRTQNPASPVTISELTQALLGYYPKKLPKAIQHFPSGNPYMQFMLNQE